MTRASSRPIIPASTSGVQLAALLNAREEAEDSGHAGTGRPTYASEGMLYSDDSFTPTHIFLAGAAGDGSDDVDLTLQFSVRPGTVRETFEVRLPDGWLWADGSAVTRATYPELLEAIAPSVTGNVASSSTTISSVSEDLRQLGLIGAKIEGTGIQSGTTITAISASTITLSLAATATNVGVTLRIFPCGNGNGSTTFNLPNRKGRVGIARGDMGGTDVALITTAGAGFDGTRLHASGGSQTVVLVVANLPVHSHSASTSGTTDTHAGHTHGAGTYVTDTEGNHTHVFTRLAIGAFAGAAKVTDVKSDGIIDIYQGAANTSGAGAHSHDISGTSTSGGSHSHVLTLSTSIGNTGSDTAHQNTQPGVVANFIVKT